MESLTPAALRRFCALHRRGVDGGREALQLIIDTQPRALADLIGRTTRPTPELIVQRVDALAAEAKAAALWRARSQSEELAGVIGRTAQRGRDGAWALPGLPLAELASLRAFQRIQFAGIGSVDRDVLDRVLRACRKAPKVEVTLIATRLRVTYGDAGARGRIALVVHPPARADDAITVALHEQVARRARPTALERFALALARCVP